MSDAVRPRAEVSLEADDVPVNGRNVTTGSTRTVPVRRANESVDDRLQRLVAEVKAENAEELRRLQATPSATEQLRWLDDTPPEGTTWSGPAMADADLRSLRSETSVSAQGPRKRRSETSASVQGLRKRQSRLGRSVDNVAGSVNNVAGAATEAHVDVEGSESHVQGEPNVDGVTSGGYVEGHAGNPDNAFAFFFSDSGSCRQSPTDAVSNDSVRSGGRRPALNGRFDDQHQTVRSLFPERSVSPVIAGLVALVVIAGLLITMVVVSDPADAAEYEVQAGDSLWSIAVAHDVTVSDLRELNDLEQSILRPGDVLIIPDPPYTGPTIEHEVLSGEAISVIAETYGVSMGDILDLNGISNANLIRVGDVLEIPAVEVDKGDETTITVTHKVRSGEVLGSIADEYDVAVATIMTANGLSNPDLIRVGDSLQVPNVIPRNETERLTAQFERWAEANELDPMLVKAVGWQESRWQEDAESHVGAMGIGQIMPGTHGFIEDRLIGVDGLDPWDSEDNIRMMSRYLDYLLEEWDGDVENALGSYYQGIGSVRSRGFYGETTDYVASVLRFKEQFEDGTLPR